MLVTCWVTILRFTVLWINLSTKYCVTALAKGYGHCLRAVRCLSHAGFPQIRAQLRFLGLRRA